jgi:hypothetical protein
MTLLLINGLGYLEKLNRLNGYNKMAATIQKPDTNFFQKMTIQNLDNPVFEWSLYMYM